MNRKGYVYTVISMLLALVLLAVVSLYYESYKSATDLSPAKIRTDELHYFVESSKKDLGRAMYISARRGAAYLDDYVINNHTTLADATLTLEQVMANGTITSGSTFNIPYMQNQTLTAFISSLQTTGSELRFRTNISLRTIEIYPYDSLHFLVLAKYNYSIADLDTAEGGVCGYENENQTLYVLIPIDGLEDPLYALKTTNKVSRVYNHSTSSGIQTLAYAAKGKGLGGGIVYDISKEEGDQDLLIADYNDLTPWLVPYTVFVINTTSAGSDPLVWADFSTPSKIVLNSSGGVIDYYSETLTNAGFPYVSGITTSINFSDKEYVIIQNGNSPRILYLETANDIVNRLYANSTNGSCFFDRLEGNANLSQKYRDQAAIARSILDQPNTATVGIESYVNLPDMNSSGLYPDITPYEGYSSIDHLYFQEISGKWVYGTPYWFRMDAYNLKIKNLTDYCYDDYAAVWHFEEYHNDGPGDYTYEGSHNAPNLDLSGDSNIVSGGINGNCLELANSGKAEAYVNVSETEYAVGLWIWPDPSCSECGIFSTDTGDDSKNDRNIYLNGVMNLCADLFVSGTDPICTADTYSDNRWHYVVHTYSNKSGAGGRHKLYVDGALKATGAVSYSNRTAQERIIIGYSTKVSNPFIGLIDDVKIWNRTLEAREITEEYEKLL
ncbi:MAG: LamG domain-containing protein [Candidatus Altiarchaeia archaeon]